MEITLRIPAWMDNIQMQLVGFLDGEHAEYIDWFTDTDHSKIIDFSGYPERDIKEHDTMFDYEAKLRDLEEIVVEARDQCSSKPVAGILQIMLNYMYLLGLTNGESSSILMDGSTKE